MDANLRVVAFDLDDTLTVSKSTIDPRMAQLLAQLLAIMDVCIISGGRFEQFETQVLRYIDAPEEQLSRLHIMPTCGTRYYTWRNGDWHMNYAEDLSDDEKSRVIHILTEGAEKLGFWESQTWGDIIEDRGSQITYSALGQAAPPEAKYAWDPDGSKKRKLRDYAASYLPDLEVRVGGSTSVDVTRQGIDKAYGISKLCERLQVPADQILFIGDRLEEGGNDYPVVALGVRLVAVTRWQDTAEYIAQFIDEQSAGD
jgi:HAD superfamily hydrolase (TIGR01484 family)